MSFLRYERYKESGVAWLGEVPEHWDVLRLGRFASERRMKVSDKDYPPLSVTKSGVVPQLETAAKTDDGDNRKLVRISNFVINGRSDRKGSSGLSTLDGSVSLINIVLELSGGLNGQFAHHLFRSVPFQEEFYRNGKGIVADLWSTGFSEMSNILLAIPSVDEQEAIAKFVDWETAKIDALIEEQRRLIALLKDKRQSVISHAVTKGLNLSATMQESDFGILVPAHWRNSRVKYAVNGIEQGWSPQCDNFPAEYGEWGVLKAGAANSGAVDPNENKRLPPEIEPLPELGIRKDDVLISRANSRELVGSVGIAKTDYPNRLLCDKLYRVTCRKDVCTPDFLTLFLRSSVVRRIIERDATGASPSMQNIGQDSILNMPIALPPLEEQAEIVGHIFRHNTHHSFLLHNAEHMIGLLEERRSALISAAVTGKINVTTRVAKPVLSTWNAGFARQVLAAEMLSRCNGPRMGRIKLQKLIHLCEYHAQLDEVRGTYSRQAAGPFAPDLMEDVREGLLQQRWFEEYKDESRYAYRALEKAGGHKQYLSHWVDKQARIDQVLNLLGSELTRKCEIASTLYAAWNDLLIEGKNPTDTEIIHEASSAERWHESKEKIAAEKWTEMLKWMRANSLVPVGYGTHTTHQPDLFAREGHEPA